jgi:hypothetical protein
MTNAIVPLDQEQSIQSVKLLANIVHALYEDVFKPGLDFGVIPGTGDKPVLLLPGMEKLMRALRLRPEYVARMSMIDFDKPLFFFQYECRLIEIDTGMVVSSAIGSANSHESKWRWRNADCACPNCGAGAIKRSKYPPKGAPSGSQPGWYCYAKIGGCGAEFRADDPAITGQQVGRVENPDIADQLNTMDKIAQKRALASAIKGAANVSELFTVDVEDLVEYAVANGAPLTQSGRAASDDNVIEGTAAVVTKLPLTKDEGKRLADKWMKDKALTGADLKKALGGSYDQWMDGYDAADKRVSDWYADQFADPKSE